ncbi:MULTISPECIES: hypothetical protein [Staphylococcus]|uniref:Uncharacterized protein n=1 Tax=Staphylococcus intermedius NCTC 11048 TaxID=1141106 RepID=A0A380FXK8_STAIN|nr:MULTISPECIES: hypothetical protein [Staphylococcus]EGQ3776075.1 hypothetical protein [Staphylococcus pseudintermedius]HDK8139671.1 hypothetical protein [Staphylococcus aureus]MDT0694125.1 hypothetical protein [Staphylococcus chromogenes]PCF80089.1 hypothetical protein B4W69_12975 [Staphylococcus delphini]PCF83897.1 hypothetical protein B4W76_12470 [Staphylococcus intermedius]
MNNKKPQKNDKKLPKDRKKQYPQSGFEFLLNKEIKIVFTDGKAISAKLVYVYTYELLLEKELSNGDCNYIIVNKAHVKYVSATKEKVDDSKEEN